MVGYIDKTGQFTIAPQLDIVDLFSFSEGLAAVRIGEFVEGKWGYIDKQGMLVIQAQFDTAGPFHDGLAVVANDRKFGYIDKTGKIVIPLQFASGGSFSDGLAAVRVGDFITGKDGYIDTQGKIVIEPRFDGAFPFADGLADVRVGDKYGFVDKQGRMVIESQFDFANSFSGGLAAVRVGDEETGQVRLHRHAGEDGGRAAVCVRGSVLRIRWIGGGAHRRGRRTANTAISDGSVFKGEVLTPAL